MILESIQQDGEIHRNQGHAGLAFLPPAGQCHNREYISFCLPLMVAWQLQYLPYTTYLCNLFQKQKIVSEKNSSWGKEFSSLFSPLPTSTPSFTLSSIQEGHDFPEAVQWTSFDAHWYNWSLLLISRDTPLNLRLPRLTTVFIRKISRIVSAKFLWA